MDRCLLVAYFLVFNYVVTYFAQNPCITWLGMNTSLLMILVLNNFLFTVAKIIVF